MNRRQALLKGFGSVGAVLALTGSGRVAKAICATVTPAQPEGPFYPVNDQLDKDNDLTYIRGKFVKATGQVIYIKGSVEDENCKPLKDAFIEIWQACDSGRYNHPGDTNTAKLDPAFQYWGKAISDENGNFLFKTILPGAYPADDGWIRPPHIHYKISKFGYEELTTQMYFRGNKYNDTDLILKKLPRSERDKLEVELLPADASVEPDAKVCNFSVVLKRP